MKYIIITGVSTGIGRALAEYYLKKWGFVFGSVRKETDATELKFLLGDRFLITNLTNMYTSKPMPDFLNQTLDTLTKHPIPHNNCLYKR
jgi:NAD(P)-dependent dehydrogenase (short-subunit alcohol dehydrogenase family)